MSKIDNLIKEMCPNGVKYKSIKEVCRLHYGKGNTIPKDGVDYDVYGCNGIVGTTNKYNNEDAPIVGHIGSAGVVTWGKGKNFVTYNGTICTPNLKVINSRYLYHNLINLHLEKYVKGNQPFLSSSDFENIKIPVFPIKVQEEIVRILDKFSELEEELEEELEIREKQYKFFQKKLLKTNSQILYKKYNICEITEKIFAGGDVPKDTIKGIDKPEGEYIYPVISNGIGQNAIYGYSKNYKVKGNTVTISARGTVGYHTVRFEKYTPIIRLITIIPNEKIVLAKYLNYVLYTTQIEITNGGIQQITIPMIKKINLDIPPLEEQQRIVNILDKFDKLINDISEGIPAEIELRRKQYEYYRNKLLDIKEVIA